MPQEHDRTEECWCDPTPAKMATIIDHLISRDAGDALRVHGGYVVITAVVTPEGDSLGAATQVWQVPIDHLPEGEFQPPTSDYALGTAAAIAMGQCAHRAAKFLKTTPQKAFGIAKQLSQKLR